MEDRNKNVCHICGKYADNVCEDCGKMVCDECTTPYTIHNQIEYTQCIDCGEEESEIRSNEYYNNSK